MDLNAGQRKTPSVLIKLTILLMVFSFSFLTYPLSETFTFQNLTAATQFDANVVFEFAKKTISFSGESNPTPKVALLFLTKGPLPHEPLWRAFFEAASKLSLRHPPPDLDYLNSITRKDREKFDEINESIKRKLSQTESRVNSTTCEGQKKLLKREMRRLMKVADDPSSVISNQALFSVYTHPMPDFHFPPTSIFHQTEVKDRIDTNRSWGQFDLVDAELRLMEAALDDTSNKKLVLLSESCVPLYPPEVIYAQLMSEHKSRMRSCGSNMDNDLYRFSAKMSVKYFSKDNWKKNPQWFALNRAHAEVLVKDTYFKDLFRQHCYVVLGQRFCPADEHYIPSTLNAYGFGNETDCTGSLTFVKFHGGDHPIAFQPSGIKPSLLLALRHTEECSSDRARTTAAALLDGLPTNGDCVPRNFTTFNISNEVDVSHNWVTERGYKPLNCRCVLFARKFPATAVRQTLRASLACEGGSLGYWC